MKAINFYKFFTLILAVVVVSSCVQDDEFDIPEIEIQSVDIPQDRIVTIGSLRTQLEQEMMTNGNDILTFETDNDSSNDLFVVGYVISNDAAGNFFEELILQDSPSSPSAGVKVLVDVNPLFNTYQFGRKVFIRLDGLSVALDSGVLSLGIRSGNELEKISEAAQTDFLLRDDELEDIIPLDITIPEFTVEKTNLYIRLNNVQFNRNQALGDNRLTFAAEADDQFDGERTLESCSSSATTIFSTSTFADFKGQLLPQGSGSIDGILTLNFFGEDFNVVVNDLSTINLDGERCDPEGIDCEGGAVTGTAFFDDNFESYNSTIDVVAAGWVIENVSGGNVEFELDEFSNNNYMLVSAFNSNEEDIESWLITPEFSLDNTNMDALNVDIQTNFNNGLVLTLMLSTDFTGSIEDATWVELTDATVPPGSASGFGSFTPAGPINLSCVDGSNVRIGFKYTGSDVSGGGTTRYHIDNVRINGN
ncbi:DUF5689 domain-containing protein [Jejudonia soesokkakensis]|uniref:DUF5689 domain-containing protein n=1 Tax=Jejudonia soesokkakensis TaxID=1323432 RepID=A0ABW2MS43_9FLAO